MLTLEILKSNSKLTELMGSEMATALESLTDDQRKAIAAASEKDETSVKDALTRDIHDTYDRDIKTLTGKEKPGGVKTYDHLKTVLGELVDQGKKVSELEAEKVRLEKKIADGSTDAEVKKQLRAAEKKLQDKEDEYKTLKTQYETETEKLKTDLAQAQTSYQQQSMKAEFAKAEAGVTFLTTIPEEQRKSALSFAQSKLSSSVTPDTIDGENGEKITVYRGADNKILRDASNGNKPHTLGSLYLQEVSWLIDKGRKQEGAGTKPRGGGEGGGSSLNLSGVTNQIDADEAIKNHLIKVEGLSRGSQKYGERQQQLREEHKVADLPLRDGGE